MKDVRKTEKLFCIIRAIVTLEYFVCNLSRDGNHDILASIRIPGRAIVPQSRVHGRSSVAIFVTQLSTGIFSGEPIRSPSRTKHVAVLRHTRCKASARNSKIVIKFNFILKHKKYQYYCCFSYFQISNRDKKKKDLP